ncbi:MAG: hypothetical protein WBM83_09880 [Flavobacteriaceae bacterium]
MNTTLLIANALVFLTFIAHTFGGDKEYRNFEPTEVDTKKMQNWLMGRGAFHIVSIDFLFASIGLALITFTDYFKDPKLLLNILSIYFLGYGLAFLITLIISKKFPNSFFKLGQWLLLILIAGMIYLGNQ